MHRPGLGGGGAPRPKAGEEQTLELTRWRAAGVSPPVLRIPARLREGVTRLPSVKTAAGG
jgi:hypothetical protein